MVYFIINGLGFDCGFVKTQCPNKNIPCRDCLINRLKEMGFEINEEIKITELDSNEKRLQLDRDLIWQRFIDVLNIKHLIIMDKESGLSLLNYAVSGADVEPELLGGFIQANISFSESNDVSSMGSDKVDANHFYEFQYKNFNILLKDGNFIRLCLILDHKASDQMRTHVVTFLYEFESKFQDELLVLRETGFVDFDEMIDYIIQAFNISLVFPMIIAHSIPPYDLEIIKNNNIQKAIFNLAKEILVSKPFFFINNLVYKVKKIVNLEAHVILYEIYQLVRREIFIPIALETVISNMENLQEENHIKVEKYKPISAILITEDDISELQEKIETMDKFTASKLIKEFIKKGKEAEKSSTYEITKKEYNKALYIANEFNLKGEISKISYLIFELDKKSKEVEIDFAIESAEHAEKNRDFINSIHHYQKALKILEDFMIYNDSDHRIKKIKKKILKLRAEV